MTVLAPHRTPALGASPRTGRRVASAAALALASAVGAIAVYAAFVRTAFGQRVDELAMQHAEVEHARLVAVLHSTLDGTSLVSVALVALVAAAIGLVRRRVDLAVAAGVFILGSNITTQLLKATLTRPVLHEAAPNSLPSGHTTAAASVALALIMVLPHAVRALVTLAGAGYVATIAVATVWAGWHRPSDVVAALLVVLAWGATTMAVVRARRGGRVDAEEPPSGLAVVPLTASALAMLVLVLAATALAMSSLSLFGAGTMAFLAGAAGMCAAVAVTFVAWLRLVSGLGRVRVVRTGAPGAAG